VFGATVVPFIAAHAFLTGW